MPVSMGWLLNRFLKSCFKYWNPDTSQSLFTYSLPHLPGTEQKSNIACSQFLFFFKVAFSWTGLIGLVVLTLQLALDSARFEFTLKMRLNRIWPKDPTYAIFLKSWVFKDVKYDIPVCQYHSTRPQPIQLVPTMQKKLFTLSFQPKFLKIWFTKVAASSIKSYEAANFFVTQSQLFLGACFGPKSHTEPHL